MAATKSPKQLAQILCNHVSTNSDNTDDLRELLARETFSMGRQCAASEPTHELTLVGSTKFACRLIDAQLTIDITEAKAATSRSYRIAYDDGAAGTPVNMTSLYDGTASAVTQDIVNDMTVTAGVIVPAGSRIYVTSTENSTGNAAACAYALHLTIEYE